jgi:hypothetical protein
MQHQWEWSQLPGKAISAKTSIFADMASDFEGDSWYTEIAGTAIN